jgi:hypothetical protein
MINPQQMALQLGLAISPLFPSKIRPAQGQHFAMLDGRQASFAYSTIEAIQISEDDSRNWQWSSDLAHHVLVSKTEVHVRSGREPQIRKFRRESVDQKLEDFIAFLDSSRLALPDVVSFLVAEFRNLWSASGAPDGNTALSSFLIALSAADQDDLGIIEDPAWRRQTSSENSTERL